MRGHNDGISCVDVSPDGRCLATGSADGTVRLWSLEANREIHTLRGHEITTFGGTRAFRKTTSYRYAIGQHSFKKGCIINAVTFSPDGLLLASAANADTIRLWDVRTGEERQTLRGHKNSVNSVAWFPDGSRLVSGSSDRGIRIWDVRSGTCLRAFQGHNDWILSVAVSPDGRCFASGGGNEDQAVYLWDSLTAKQIGRHLRE